jgi:GGDEF domain-containing protein
MVRPVQHRVLLIGDARREVYGALAQALPAAQVTSVGSMFEGIAELTSGTFTAVVAAAEPVERRPEAAVRTLRELAGESRLILFGHPTLELLSRKMLSFGADDYVVTPVAAAELQHVFGTPPLRLAGAGAESRAQSPAADDSVVSPTAAADALERLNSADLLLDAMLQHPHDAPAAAVTAMNARLPESLARLVFVRPGEANPPPEEGRVLLTHALRHQQDEAGTLCLLIQADQDESAARHALAQLAHLLMKLSNLQERHNLLQRLAITDELTGLYNARYFRHFLSRIIERGRVKRFPVTLLLFDIDDFKKYNDQFGHGVGDDILKQTASLMKRCCRDHDLVARIGGDEFAVVFWDKEGPRQPREPKATGPSRAPQTPIEIFKRFRRLMNGVDFTNLGATGRGTLGISAGMAVYPYDASDAASLIKAADGVLMFGAKQSGKNSIYLVGGEAEIDQP